MNKIDSRVPQTGLNVFNYPIIPLTEIVKNEKIYHYLKSSFTSQFKRMNLQSEIIETALVKCLDLAKITDDLLIYEKTAYSILREAKILKDFPELISDREKIMIETLKPYLVNNSILDLGCGTGKISQVLSKKGYQLHLADVYKNDYIREHLSQLPFSLIENEKHLPFENSFFDNVLIFTVLHHTSDPLKMLKEVKRILKPAGRLHLIETVFGIDKTESSNLSGPTKEFINLSHEEQRLVTMFFDYFGNHVTAHYTTDPKKLIPVPFNFNEPKKWLEIFNDLGYKVIEKKHLGVEPNTGVYHIFFSLEA